MHFHNTWVKVRGSNIFYSPNTSNTFLGARDIMFKGKITGRIKKLCKHKISIVKVHKKEIYMVLRECMLKI